MKCAITKLIRDSFVPAFLALADTIKERIAEAENDTWETNE